MGSNTHEMAEADNRSMSNLVPNTSKEADVDMQEEEESG